MMVRAAGLVFSMTIPVMLMFDVLDHSEGNSLLSNGCVTAPEAKRQALPIYVDTTSYFIASDSMSEHVLEVLAGLPPGREFELWANDTSRSAFGVAKLGSWCIPPRNNQQAIHLALEPASNAYYAGRADHIRDRVLDVLNGLSERISDRSTSYNSPLLETAKFFLENDQYEDFVVLSDALQDTDSRRFCLRKMNMPLRRNTSLLPRESMDVELTRGKRVTWVQIIVPGRQQRLPYCVENEATQWWKDHWDLAGVHLKYTPKTLNTKKPEVQS